MRILHVINSLLVGGAERSLVHSAKALEALDCEVEVCTIFHGGPFADEIRAAGLQVHNLGVDPGFAQFRASRKYDPRSVPRLARLINRGRYDIVHSHLFPTNYITAAARLVCRGPRFVVTEHNVFNRRRRGRIFRVLESALYSRYDAIVAVSAEVGESLAAWQPQVAPRMLVIPNAVQIEEGRSRSAAAEKLRTALGLEQAESIVLFVGRLEHPKGPDILLSALPALFAARPRARALFVGDGSMRQQCNELLVELSLTDKATLLGARKDIRDLMALADLVVLPSRWEGLPLTLLEALAMATPVVATNVGGVANVVNQAEAGWIVPPNDTDALACALTKALSDPGSRAVRGRKGQAFVAERHAVSAGAEAHVDLYNNLTGLSTPHAR